MSVSKRYDEIVVQVTYGHDGTLNEVVVMKEEAKKCRVKKESAGSCTCERSSTFLVSHTLPPFLFLTLRTTRMSHDKSPITCHVLDSTRGKPGAGVKVQLDRLEATGGATVLASG